MYKILATIILVGGFFILFFNPSFELKNKREKIQTSMATGFIEDTNEAFIIPTYPTQLIEKDMYGNIKPIYGDIGNFIPYTKED